VRAIARQQFDFVPQETVILQGGGRDLVLPERPVIVDALNPLTVVEMDDFQRVRIDAVEHQHFARLNDRLSKRWRRQWQPAMQVATNNYLWQQVTYSHGYYDPPEWLTAIVVEVAQTLATNPQGLYSEKVGGIELVFHTKTVTGRDSIDDRIKAALSAVGLRRGGAFSIGPS
jgi:hypothetical protein